MTIWEELQEIGFSLDAAFISRVLISLAILITLILLRRWVLSLARRNVTDIRARYNWQKGTAYILAILVALLIGPLWLGNLGQLATYLGLLSAGLAVALRDPLANLFGWAYLLWRRPFSVGDRIQIGTHAGDVIDKRIFQFSLMEIGNWVDSDQSTGRLIHVPNSKVFLEPLANYSQGFNYIWNEVSVNITFESNWEKAKRHLGEIADRHSASEEEVREDLSKTRGERFLLYYRHLTPVVYTSVIDYGVRLAVRYLCEPRLRRSTAQAIWEDVLRFVNENPDIQLAYPTRRNVVTEREGSPGFLKKPD